ncbi:MAG: ABC transporter ATP-binding protein [Bacillota bacterium]|nr:ABC transporter ATP-binding protein [Bacillota bacterium]
MLEWSSPEPAPARGRTNRTNRTEPNKPSQAERRNREGPEGSGARTEAAAALLDAEGLTYAYGEYRAVDGASFAIRPGELVALVGRNGAGKSTLLECLAGWRRPERGRVRLLGTPVGEEEVRHRSAVLLVPDTPPFYEQLTAWEHLAFVAQLRRRPAAEWQPEAERLLRRFTLWEQRNGYPYAFSRGMRTKLAVAVALVARPQVLLLDEPFGPLDPISAADLWQELTAFATGGAEREPDREPEQEHRAGGGRTAVLLSSHRLPPEVEPDRILVLEQGRLLAEGSPATLRARYGLDSGDSDAILRAALLAARREGR